jgi:hypothetical protein
VPLLAQILLLRMLPPAGSLSFTAVATATPTNYWPLSLQALKSLRVVCLFCLYSRSLLKLVWSTQALHERLPFWHIVICANEAPADTQGLGPERWKEVLASKWPASRAPCLPQGKGEEEGQVSITRLNTGLNPGEGGR